MVKLEPSLILFSKGEVGQKFVGRIANAGSSVSIADCPSWLKAEVCVGSDQLTELHVEIAGPSTIPAGYIELVSGGRMLRAPFLIANSPE
jgi:hypothetical protein